MIDSCDSQSALTRTQNSPIFVAQPWKFGGTSVGTGQYVDAFQRGEFYSQTKPTGINPGYHVKLALTTHAPLVLHVPTADAAESTTVCGTHKLGAVEINYLDSADPALHHRHTRIGGHDDLPTLRARQRRRVRRRHQPVLCARLPRRDGRTPAGCRPTAWRCTTTPATSAGSADTAVMSHEVAEWMNDPFGNNPTKPWGNIGQVSGCQDNLEVGDPLSGTAITDTLNGKTYHLQELAFFSWFYHSSPSLGVNGWFSSNGTFTNVGTHPAPAEHEVEPRAQLGDQPQSLINPGARSGLLVREVNKVLVATSGDVEEANCKGRVIGYIPGWAVAERSVFRRCGKERLIFAPDIRHQAVVEPVIAARRPSEIPAVQQ